MAPQCTRSYWPCTKDPRRCPHAMQQIKGGAGCSGVHPGALSLHRRPTLLHTQHKDAEVGQVPP